MTRLAVLADDLTGALDATAPFAARGLRTVVALGPDGLAAALASGADIVGVSTDSRETTPDEARQAVAACVALLPSGLSIFKKVDSRLKGNVEAELDAIPFSWALVVPAIPAFARVVRDGCVVGFGVSEPIDIAARLGRHAKASTIPDIADQAAIDATLSTIAHDLPIGARGLAEALAVRLAPVAVTWTQPALAGPAICIIGSTDAITLAQVAHLRRACPGLAHVAAPNGVMDEAPPPAALTLLQATPGATNADPAQVAAALGQAVLRLAPRPGTTLLISGGATAQIVLQALGIGLLELLGEARPGLPIARAGGFTIITKSGGFGTVDALQDVLGHLAETKRERQF